MNGFDVPGCFGEVCRYITQLAAKISESYDSSQKKS